MAEEQTQAPSSWEQNVMQSVLMESIKEQRSSRRWGIFFKGITLSYFFILLFLFWSPSKTLEHQQEHIGVVDIKGMISASDEANADTIIGGLRKAFEAEHSKAVIIRINSGGGSPVQANYVFNEIMRLKAKYTDKKVYAVISDIGGSAAYYMAVAADEIYADQGSIVGSIGVLMMGFGFEGTLDKVGAQARTLYSGENKMFLDPFSPVKPEHKQHAQALLKTVHEQFIAAVKKGRGDRIKDDPSIYSGLFWTGSQALELGVIDGLGSAGYVARDVLGVELVVNYTEQGSVFDKISKRMSSAIKDSFTMSAQDMQPSLTLQ